MAVQTVVSWREAEDALLEAMALMARLPDRERGFLSAGSRSGWPDVVRSVRDGEYPEARGRVGLRRAEVDRLDVLMLGVGAVVMQVPAADQALLGRVLVEKLDERGEGFRWERVWEWDDRRRRAQGRQRVTADAVRKRYERAVAAVAVALDKLPERARACALGFGAA
jgi:hypothetical protein